MWANPFKTSVPRSALSYSSQPSAQPDATDYFVMPNSETLDDVSYPEQVPNIWSDDSDDFGLQDTPSEMPAYLGTNQRIITETPGQRDTHAFLAPAPGSTDLIEPRDTGGIPATVYFNEHTGPVTGRAFDVYQNIRQGLLAVQPGQLGPVVGGPDQGEALSAAFFQAQFATQSNAASDAAMVNAV